MNEWRPTQLAHHLRHAGHPSNTARPFPFQSRKTTNFEFGSTPHSVNSPRTRSPPIAKRRIATPQSARWFVSPPPSLHFTIRSRSFQPPKVRSRSKAFHRARPTLTADAIPRVRAAHDRHAQRSNIISQLQTYNVIHRTVRAGAFEKLKAAEDEAAIVRWVSEKVLESYGTASPPARKASR